MLERLFKRKNLTLESFLLSGIFCISVAILFLPTIGVGYFFLDDQKYVISNPYVALGITWDSIIWALSSLFFGQWHPLTWLSYMLETQIAGFSSDLQRLDNILLHCINSTLIYVALSRIGFKKLVIIAIVLCFAFGPISADPINSSRKDLLSLTFSLLTLLSYLKWRETNYLIKSFISVAIFYVFALASKPGIFLLPLLLILADFLQNPPSWNYSKIKKVAAYFALLVIISSSTVALNIFAHYSNDAIAPNAGTNLIPVFGTAFSKLLVNLWLVLDPSQVVFAYPSDLTIDSLPQIVLLLLSLALIFTVVISKKTLATSRSGIILGFVWFFVFIAPYIGVLQVGVQTFANRWIYGAQVGLLIVIFITLYELTRRRIKLLTTLAALSIFCFLVSEIYFGQKQLQAWNDPTLLFKHSESTYQNNITSYLNKISYQSFKLSQGSRAQELPSDFSLFEKILESSPHNYRARRSLIETPQDKTQFNCNNSSVVKILNSFNNPGQTITIKLETVELLFVLNQSEFWENCFQAQFKETSLEVAQKILTSPELQSSETYQKELLLTELFMRKSNSLQAKQHLDKALELNPFSCKVDRTAASFWFKAGNHPQALYYLKAANICDPTDVKLAELYSKSVFLWGDRSELSKFVSTYNHLKQLKAELLLRESK